MTIASILLIFGIESDDLIRKFISVLSAAKGEDGKVFLRLKLLTTLFNMLSSSGGEKYGDVQHLELRSGDESGIGSHVFRLKG